MTVLDLNDEFETLHLPGGGTAWRRALPAQLLGVDARACRELFAVLWTERTERPSLRIHGRETEIPRWQQAYGKDYSFSHQTSVALPMPEILSPFLVWARTVVDPRLNGVLVNWYAAAGDSIGDGRISDGGDYIGPHRDSREGLVADSPIVTISLGGKRAFRLRKFDDRKQTLEIPVSDGTVIVLPFATNLAYTHEVPHPRSSRGETGRRISITLRAFA